MGRRLGIVVLVLALLGACKATSVGEVKPYRIGYMVCNSKQETLRRFRPLTAYLSQRLGVPFEAVAIHTRDFGTEVEDLHFTHTNSLLYVILNRFHGVQVLAAEKAGPLGYKTQGAIVALRESGIRSLEDLRGKSMVFGPMLSPVAYLSQLDLLLKAGLEPEEDLAFYTIPQGTYKHEKVIYGVWFGKYAAGAFPMLDFERMIQEGRVPAEDFVVLAKGPLIPYCNFAATQKVDEALARRFKQALLELTYEDTVRIDGKVVKVLEAARVEGYVDVRDEEFDIIRQMARRTNMPPYQRY